MTTTTTRPTDYVIERRTASIIIVQASRNGLVTYTVAPEHVTVASTVDAQPPAEVWAVVSLIQAQFGCHLDLFLADHNHGDVQTPGAWSIAHEGHYEWPSLFTAAQQEPGRANSRLTPANVFCEPIAGWCLGVYPA